MPELKRSGNEYRSNKPKG